MNTTAFQLEQSETYILILNVVLVVLIPAILDRVSSENQINGKIIIWKNKEGDDNQRNRKKWIKVLRDYEPVERSIQEFRKITSKKRVGSFFKIETKSAVIGFVLALTSFIIIYGIIPEIINSLFPFNYSTFGILIICVNFLPTLYLIDKCKERPEIKSIEEFVEINEKLDKEFTPMRNFFIYFNYIVGLTIYNIIKNEISVLGDNNFIVLVIFWSLSLLLGVLTYRLVKQWKEEFIDCLKKIINKNYSKEFPYIVTNIPNIEGQLKDVFNEDFLVLDEEGIEKTTFWSSIKYMHIR